MVRRARPPHSRKQEPLALGRWRRVSQTSPAPPCPVPKAPPLKPRPTWLAPGSPGIPVVAGGAELAVGTLGVVLAEAEPAEVVTVATARVPMPIALAGPTAARARGIAEAAGPAPLAVLPPRPVCGGPSRQDTESGARVGRGLTNWLS